MPTQRNPRDDPTWYDAAVLDEIMTIDCRLGVVNGDNATAEWVATERQGCKDVGWKCHLRLENIAFEISKLKASLGQKICTLSSFPLPFGVQEEFILDD